MPTPQFCRNTHRRRLFQTLLVFSLLLAFVAVPRASADEEPGPNRVQVVFLHMNDIYEITPLRNGTAGGLARVATLIKLLQKEHEHFYTMHAGDFLSPSPLGNAKVDGKPLAGRQMVAVMKTIGLDFLILGNHEFDLREDAFDARIDELTQFNSIPALKEFPDQNAVKKFEERRRVLFSTNVNGADGKPLPNVPRDRIIEIPLEGDVTLRIGVLGLTMHVESKYATMVNPVDAAKAHLAKWKAAGQEFDAILAITHQSLAEDEKLARAVPEIDFILGGHEHVNTYRRALPDPATGKTIASITRADANAITVFIHTVTFDLEKKRIERIDSHLQSINDAIPEDPYVASVVKHWNDLGLASLRKQGYDPTEVLTKITTPYDGRESQVRTKATNLTKFIGDAMLHALPKEDAALSLAVFNSGSIRIDDFLYPGAVTMYDVYRVLPYPGKVLAVKYKGADLRRILEEQGKNPGSGAFLQFRNLEGDEAKGWKIAGKDLEDATIYTVAINDYLGGGHQEEYAFIGTLPKQGGAKELADWHKLVADAFRQLHSAGTGGGTPGPNRNATNAPIPIRVSVEGVPGTTPTETKHTIEVLPVKIETEESPLPSWWLWAVLGVMLFLCLFVVMIVWSTAGNQKSNPSESNEKL